MDRVHGRSDAEEMTSRPDRRRSDAKLSSRSRRSGITRLLTHRHIDLAGNIRKSVRLVGQTPRRKSRAALPGSLKHALAKSTAWTVATVARTGSNGRCRSQDRPQSGLGVWQFLSALSRGFANVRR